MKELLARIRALTRRRTGYGRERMQFEDVTLSAESFELSCENAVRLSVKEFELMQTLMMNSGKHIITSDFLLERVWGSEPEAGEDTVQLYVSYLQRKLKAVSSKVRISSEREGSYELTGD